MDDGTHSYIYATGTTPIAQIDDTTGAVKYLHNDNVGSVRTVTDNTGAVVSTTDYTPYGAVAAHSGTSGSAFGYASAWTDPVTGTDYLRAREYDPQTGQFLQVDPVINQTRQPYAYASSSPANHSDPTGLSTDPNTSPDTQAQIDVLQRMGDVQEALCVTIVCTRQAETEVSYLTTPEGQVIAGYALGIDPGAMYYGASTGLVQDLSQVPETVAARDRIKNALRSGTATLGLYSTANYKSGSPSPTNLNLLRDAYTYTHWSISSPTARLYAALGSYALSGVIQQLDCKNRTATIFWTGSNSMTLGSALGLLPNTREFLNNAAVLTGVGREVDQYFYLE